MSKDIYELKLTHTAEVLMDSNADVVGLLKLRMLLFKTFSIIIWNVNTAIFIMTLPMKEVLTMPLIYIKIVFKIITSRPIKNTLLNNDRTRDILLVMGEYGGHAISIIFVCHYMPSNYGGAEQFEPKIMDRFKNALVKNEVLKILDKDPKAEIVILGDFNEEPTADNVQSLKEVGLINLMDPMVGKPKTGTYVFRGKDSLIDQIIVHKNLQDDYGLSIGSEGAYILDLPKYRQQDGRYKSLSL